MERIKIIVADYKKYSQIIKKIRYEVFVKEQNVPPELEMDEFDKIALHVLFYIDDKPVATGRMIVKDGHIGRIAVLKNFRNKHIGYGIMLFLMEKAKEFNLGKVWLSAQITAIGFYEKLGFRTFGEYFYEAGIKHVKMEKSLE